MGNLLSIYLDKRLTETQPSVNNSFHQGPVITFSREVGCNGLKLAKDLIEVLNAKDQSKRWKFLSKEILFESARELNTDYSRITKVLKNTDKYVFEEILNAFSDKNYKSERKIVKTVVEVIHSFAVDGYCVIVGRAGHIIAKDIKNALHLRLTAPLEYRIKTIMENNGLNKTQALEFINRVEKERIVFRKALGEIEYRDEDFDLVLNRASFDNKAIIEIIEKALTSKKR
jgi:cytidylate kinase